MCIRDSPQGSRHIAQRIFVQISEGFLNCMEGLNQAPGVMAQSTHGRIDQLPALVRSIRWGGFRKIGANARRHHVRSLPSRKPGSKRRNNLGTVQSKSSESQGL